MNTRLSLLALALASCGGDDAATPDAPAVQDDARLDAPGDTPPASGRATADRPDDVTGYQVHVIYAIPSDGADRALDTNGTLAATVGSWSNWFATATGNGRRFRLDTFDGALDITFARLPSSDAAIEAEGAFVRDRLEDELTAMGLVESDKLYAVYYDGGSNYACGGGPFPPALVGRVGALYLQGRPPGAPGCNTQSFVSSPTAAPTYLEFAMIHELFHALGAAPTCAPNHALNGHVGDMPTDLMYAGNQAWRPSVLDAGRNDYFDHGRSDCLDVARSVFIDPLPANALPPPGW